MFFFSMIISCLNTCCQTDPPERLTRDILEISKYLTYLRFAEFLSVTRLYVHMHFFNLYCVCFHIVVGRFRFGIFINRDIVIYFSLAYNDSH